ncbi:MAG: sodium-dependent transporter [Sneathiella sp.]
MPREQWASRYGFVLASIGGAVGIGNLWRFSYVAGENGGAVFLFVYLACVLLIGIPLMVAELTIGRQAQGDAVKAFEAGSKPGRWEVVGWLGVIAAALLLSYYAVIAGWALKYFVGAATGDLWRASGSDYGGYFQLFIADLGEPIIWQAATLAIAMFVVAGGVRQGIERINRILVPFLAGIIILLAGYALSLPGSAAGVSFLFSPDWSVLQDPGMYIAALGQAFFSLGVGMAFFITYGSYMPRTFSAPGSAVVIAVGDTLFAIIAGLAIFPAVFALGGNPAAGPELAFITLPQIFLKMPAGDIIGSIFFLLLATAAITSMVALLEIPVSVVMHRLQVRRWRATAVTGVAIFLLGIPSALTYGVLNDVRIGSYGILDSIDYGVSNFMLPIIGIGTALFVGWRLEQTLALSESGLDNSRTGYIWLWLIRFLVPVTIIGILVQSTGAL